MELVFIRAVWVVLCFVFVAATVLITHQCFDSCWTVLAEHKSFLPPSLLPVSRLEEAKRFQGDMAGTADHYWPTGYPVPYDALLRNKTWGKRVRKWKCLELGCLSSQVTIACAEDLLPSRRLYICWPVGSSEFTEYFKLELIRYFALLAYATFVLPVKLLQSQSTSLLTSFLLSPHPREREASEWMGACLATGQGKPPTFAN